MVSAVGIHETDGSILMAEDFVTNPEVPIGVRVEAVQYTIEAMKAYASMSGRLLMATVSNQHLGHLMAGNGFRQMPGVVMFYPTLDTPVAPVRAILTKKEEAPEEASSADMDKGDIVSTGDKPDKRSVSRRKKRRPVKRKVKK